MTEKSKREWRVWDAPDVSTPPGLTAESEQAMSTSQQPSLKERQRQERELLIMKAAGDLLVVRGYHETSLDDIAARVGISKGTIYLHFASKEDLVLALLKQGTESFMQALDSILSGSGSPSEKLGAIIDLAEVGLSDQRTRLMGALFQNGEVQTRMKEWHDIMRHSWEGPQRLLTEVIEQGKADGDFDPALPTPLIISLLMSLMSPFTYRRLVDSAGMTPAEISKNLRRFFFKGIGRATPPCPTEN